MIAGTGDSSEHRALSALVLEESRLSMMSIPETGVNRALNPASIRRFSVFLEKSPVEPAAPIPSSPTTITRSIFRCLIKSLYPG